MLIEIEKITSIKKIILSNNNPEIDINDWVDDNFKNQLRFELINQAKRHHCVKRFEIAKNLDYDYYLCPDDDLFLTKIQYESVILNLINDPSRVYGIRGQTIRPHDNKLITRVDIRGVDCELDILNCFYAFTREHVTEYFELIRKLNIQDLNDLMFVDDIFLSFCGDGLPRCLNVGPMTLCETEALRGIATWREDGFRNKRLEAYGKLNMLKPRI